MFALAVVCLSLVAADAPPLSPDQLRAYEEARAKAGSNADAQVKLALWCEAHGWDAGRLKHLALAVLNDPKHAAARGLMGLVAHQGEWVSPDKVGAKLKADEAVAAKLAEYNRRRAALDADEDVARVEARRLAALGRSAQARLYKYHADRKLAPLHVQLGLWCEQNGLKPEATAHFTAAVVLDPHREATWKHLGYLKHNGRWMSKEQIAAEEREAHARKQADKHWDPLFKRWKAWLGDKARRDEALERLSEVKDPRAVPAVERAFLDGNPADQRVAVQVLGQVDSPDSTHALAQVALLGATDDVRGAATGTLRGREKRDYAGWLVDLIHAPMKYQFQPVQGPGASGALLVETPRFRLLRKYDAPPAFKLGGGFYGYAGYDANGLPVVVQGKELRKGRVNLAAAEERTAEMIAAAQFKAVAAQQRLAADVMDIETYNAEAEVTNARAATILKHTLDVPDELGTDEDAWHAWWYDQLGYKYEPPPQIQVVQNAIPQSAAPHITSCFVAGTPVRTIDGPRPIESLHVGDQVLSQDAATGALSFQPVLVVHHNAPSRTLRVKLDSGETLVPSIYHRFWRAGLGWAEARHLKAGDVLRTLGGRSRVEAVESGDTVPVYNLDVAGGRTFFVGKSDALVHDNTLPEAHLRPFDAEPPLARR